MFFQIFHWKKETFCFIPVVICNISMTVVT